MNISWLRWKGTYIQNLEITVVCEKHLTHQMMSHSHHAQISSVEWESKILKVSEWTNPSNHRQCVIKTNKRCTNVCLTTTNTGATLDRAAWDASVPLCRQDRSGNRNKYVNCLSRRASNKTTHTCSTYRVPELSAAVCCDDVFVHMLMKEGVWKVILSTSQISMSSISSTLSWDSLDTQTSSMAPYFKTLELKVHFTPTPRWGYCASSNSINTSCQYDTLTLVLL